MNAFIVLNFWLRGLSKRCCYRFDRGATAVEYAIMLGAIAAVIIATVFTLGTAVESIFQDFLTLWLSL